MTRYAAALFGLFCAATLPSAHAAGAARPEFSLTASGDLEIGPDGKVHRHSLDDGLSANVQALVEKNVANWTFEPILVDGKPVIAKTRMSLSIDALPASGDGYVLKVSNVWFGSPKGKGTQRPPTYPTAAIKAGLGARVMLVVKIDGQGNVVDVHPYQTSLSMKARENVAKRWRARFEERSIAAIRTWKFTPGESIGGVASGNTAMVPIVFTVTEHGERHDPSRWRGYAPGPITPAPWVDASSLAGVDTDALQDSQPASLDSRFRLLTDVRGEAL